MSAYAVLANDVSVRNVDYSGSCGDKVKWHYDAAQFTLIIQGEGDMTDYNDSAYVPWKSVRALIKNAVVKEGVTSLGSNSFCYCASLKTVELPSTLTSIGEKCFGKCFDLETIDIPSSVISIGSNAFYFCASLTSITLPSNVTYIGRSAFQKCSGLTSFIIPPNVTSIEYGTFSGCTSLTTMTIPSSVTSIDEFAFNDCFSLNSIEIPDSVSSIQRAAFKSCSSLTNISLPSNLTIIGKGAFSFCRSLENITIPSTVEIIEQSVFYECSSLSNITIPNGTKTIETYAFFGTNLTTITIPSNVTSIDSNVFSNCDNLVSIKVDDENKKYMSVNGVLFERDRMKLVQYPSGKEGDYVIPDDVTTIMDYSFQGSQKLTSVTIPPSVKKIGNSPFYKCNNLVSININTTEGQFKSIDGVLFDKTGTELIQYPCGKNETYVIPDNVHSIVSFSFGGCDRLKNVTISNDVTSIKKYAFQECNSLTSITIPSSVSSIGDSPFAGCINLDSINVDVHNLNYTSIDGVLFTHDKTILVAYPCGHSSTYTVPNHVRAIGNYAFYECSGLSSVTIPANVTAIGNHAFNDVNMAYVNYLGSTEPECIEKTQTAVTTFVNVGFVCVPLNYSSSRFCRKFKVRVDSCEKFVAQNNQCYQVLDWQTDEITVKKRANATLWEKKTNNCFQYECKNESGGIAWSKCNSTDGIHRMCIDNKCVEEKETMNEDKWAVEILTDIPPFFYDADELSDALFNETGMQKGEMSIGTESISGTGNIVRIVVYVDDEEKANTVARFLEKCYNNK